MFMKKLVLLFTSLMAAVILAVPVVGLPSTTEVIQQVKQMEQSLTGGEGTTVVKIVDLSVYVPTDPLPDGSKHSTPYPEQQNTYKWAFQIPEWKMEKRHAVGSDHQEVIPPFQSGYQGGKYRRYIPSLTSGKTPGLLIVAEPAASHVGIDPLFANYLGFEYVFGEKKKLSEELVEAGVKVRGEETVDGVSTVVLTGKPSKMDSSIWWLAPAYGYRVLKHEDRWTYGSDKGDQKFVETRTYSDFSEVASGVWLPKRTTVEKIEVKPDGSNAVSLNVDSMTRFDSINKPLDPTKLVITPAEGANIQYRDK